MKKLYIATVLFALLFTANGYSQQQSYISIQYAVGFGAGDQGDFISTTSFRGALIEYRGAVNDNLLIGIDLGWNVFYEKKAEGVYTSGTEALSGTQYRYQNAVPILVSADYIFTPSSKFKPYGGLGIGTVYNERATDMNIYRLQENVWQFALKPEVGFLYEISYGTSFKMAAKYYYGFKTSKLESQGYFSLSAGFAFILD